MGDKTGVEVTGNYEFGEILNGAATKTMTVKEGGALAVQSAQALACLLYTSDAADES